MSLQISVLIALFRFAFTLFSVGRRWELVDSQCFPISLNVYEPVVVMYGKKPMGVLSFSLLCHM